MRSLSPLLLVLVACSPSGDSAVDRAVARLELHPPVVGLDTETTVAIRSSRSALVPGATTLDLGPGLEVRAVTVHDGYHADAVVRVPADAALGPYDATVASDRREWALPGALTVVAESITVSPAVGKLGQLLQLEVTGRNTTFVDGRTWASVGDAARVLAVDVHGPTEATLTVSVLPNARPGRHDVAMEDGPDRVVLYDGFTVDRAAVTAVFDPPEVWQGDIVEFRIEGRDTTFLTGTPVPTDDGGQIMEGASAVEFWDRAGRNADIDLLAVAVPGPRTITGTLRVSNAAALGLRDVFVTGFEDLLVPDALVVRERKPDLSAVAVGLYFNVTRSVSQATGDVREVVSAQAYFIVPLSPPCVQPSHPVPGPPPYDVNVLVEVPEPPDRIDCPNAHTVSAGDVVWLEGPTNTVTLHKYVIQSTGQIVYRGQDLTLADYQFGTVYDLRTQGDPDGIPAVLLEEVQPTVPADFALLSPELCCGETHDRTSPLELLWTPAHTYPSAFFRATVSGTYESSGLDGFVSALPWDDGQHTFPAGQLLYLAPGAATLAVQSEISGPRFGLPGNLIQTNRATSVVRTSGVLELR